MGIFAEIEKRMGDERKKKLPNSSEKENRICIAFANITMWQCEKLHCILTPTTSAMFAYLLASNITFVTLLCVWPRTICFKCCTSSYPLFLLAVTIWRRATVQQFNFNFHNIQNREVSSRNSRPQMTLHFDFDNVLNWNVKNEKLIAFNVPHMRPPPLLTIFKWKCMYWMDFSTYSKLLYAVSFAMFSCQVLRNNRDLLKSRWSLLKYILQTGKKNNNQRELYFEHSFKCVRRSVNEPHQLSK